MSRALARHDALARAAVEGHRGVVVKTTGDGMLATFGDPVDAIAATLALLRALADAEATGGVALSVRCGLHAGVVERRDHDLFGTPANRAARIMGAAHGGQALLSQAVAVLVRERLPAGVTLRDWDPSGCATWQARNTSTSSCTRSCGRTFPRCVRWPRGRTTCRRRSRRSSAATASWPRPAAVAGFAAADADGGGRPRQDAAVAAACGRRAGRLRGWRVAGRAGAAVGCAARPAGRGVGAGREGRGRAAGSGSARWRRSRDRQQLLVLDNCEHVASACAELVSVSAADGSPAAGPGDEPRAAARCRRAIYPVPPLSVPDPRKVTGPRTSCGNSKRCACSSSAPWPCSPAFR